MSDLARIIKELIEAEGPISVARYMQLALMHPAHGYYVKGNPLGKDGDFITSPEISQMFGEMVGVWCAEMWQRMECPSPFVFLELGPGRGTLMNDALRATAKVAGFHEAMQLRLFESNEILRAALADNLALHHPAFIDDLAELPPLPLIVVSNEFFDALPVHQYVKTEKGWRERMIALAGEALVFAEGEQQVPLPLPEELSFFEVSPQAVAVQQILASHIVKHGGAALTVDYGYARPTGQNTLQAVSRHAFSDPLKSPGQSDITAHVDFSALRLAAQKQGAFVSETVSQEAFLKALGIEIRADQLKHHATPEQAEVIQSTLARLTDPAQMGALFKVQAMTGAPDSEIPGFP